MATPGRIRRAGLEAKCLRMMAMVETTQHETVMDNFIQKSTRRMMLRWKTQEKHAVHIMQPPKKSQHTK
eukprot:1642548-Lingulodinium_polyedra.AAC.1